MSSSSSENSCGRQRRGLMKSRMHLGSWPKRVVSEPCTQQLCVGAHGPASGTVIRRVRMDVSPVIRLLVVHRAHSKSAHGNRRAASNVLRGVSDLHILNAEQQLLQLLSATHVYISVNVTQPSEAIGIFVQAMCKQSFFFLLILPCDSAAGEQRWRLLFH